METRKEVRTIQVDYRCPKCNRGFLRPTGNVLTVYPPRYPHKCNNPECDYGETFSDKAYPYIDYEAVDNTIKVVHGNTVMTVYGKGDDEFCVDKEQ